MIEPYEIYKVVEKECKKKGISQQKLLSDIGLAKSTLDNMKKGSMPSVDKVSAIAEYLGVTIDYLLGIEKEIQIDFYSMIQKDKTKPRIEWIEILNQLSDEDLKKMESYAAFLVSEAEKEKENPPVTIKNE